MHLIEFINKYPDWESRLTQNPYFISVKRRDNLIIFNYTMGKSDFFVPLVQECRGLIVDERTKCPVCYPFRKFGNYGEAYADKIDWESASCQEKLDGSIIKLWHYDGEWKVSTNGTINAEDADTQSHCEYKNFYELFISAFDDYKGFLNTLDRKYVYMFELCSMYNRIVVPHNKTFVSHIGTRNMDTLLEEDLDIGIPKPRKFSFNNMQEAIEMASTMPFSEEGYVVVDKNWNRVKIKSPAYLIAHHIRGDGNITKRKAMELHLIGEEAEFLNYYPEYQKLFDELVSNTYEFVYRMNNLTLLIKDHRLNFKDRKEFAEFANGSLCPPFLFQWYDKKVDNAKEWLYNRSAEKIIYWTERVANGKN